MKNIFAIAAFLSIPAAWVTHIIVAIQAKAWIFMIVGALLAPVAVIHGYATWFGFDWLN